MAGEWKATTLGEVVQLQRGYDLPEPIRNSGTVPVMGSFGVTGWHDKARTRGPGVTVGRSGASIGVVSYCESDYWPLNTCMFVTDFRENNPRFCYYWLKLIDLAAYNSGSAQPSLNRNYIYGIPVSIPPPEEQRAISHILGTLDDKIELNRRMNETLEALARAIFKSWFVDLDPVRAKAEGRDPGLPKHIADLFPDRFEDSELGEIPAGWKVDTLGDMSQKPQYGFTASANSEPIGPKFLRIADINKQAWIDWASVPFCSVSPENYEKYKAQIGDILIARMADPGHGVMIEEEVEAVIASYLIRFEPRDTEYSRYIQYWLRSDAYWELVKARSAGTTRANLNAKVLSMFPLILPSRAVVSAFREVANSLRSTVVSNVEQSHTLATIRDALLPRLISGELRVGHQNFAEKVF